MLGLDSHTSKHRLFNGITVLLISVWVMLVALIVEATDNQPMQPQDSIAEFIRMILS